MSDDLEPIRGSGNVWRDFGYADADLRQAKSILGAHIIGMLDDRGLSVRAANRETGFAAADFSRVRNAKLQSFTLERLIRMAQRLDPDLGITLDFERITNT